MRVSKLNLFAALWELLQALASIRVCAHFTDPLDDAELYRLLLKEVLPNQTTAPPSGFAVNTRLDVSEYGTLEDSDGTDTWLRYYAGEQIRAEWDLVLSRYCIKIHASLRLVGSRRIESI